MANEEELSELEKIDLHTNEVQEIFERIPPWILRWGMVHFTIIIGILIIGSFFYKYPDTINCSIIILSENPPISIFASSTGNIEDLLVRDNNEVNEGQLLAIIENAANYEHILVLEKRLQDFKLTLNDPDHMSKFDEVYNLGSIQSSFSLFLKQLKELNDHLTIDITSKQILALKQQIEDYNDYYQRIAKQLETKKEVIKLSQKQFKRDSALAINGYVSFQQFENSTRIYLEDMSDYQQLLGISSETKMQINQLRFKMINIESENSEKKKSLSNLLKTSSDNLVASIAEWKKKYLLISPINGKIIFNDIWEKNQFVSSGEQVFSIIPSNVQKIIGKAKIPSVGSGKIKGGQMVLIKLNNFPSNEFGLLLGTVNTISLLPEKKQDEMYYNVNVNLNNGLKTHIHKTIPFNQNMNGSAEIITENISLFDRIIAPIKFEIEKSYQLDSMVINSEKNR